jgi:hypothetical protein
MGVNAITHRNQLHKVFFGMRELTRSMRPRAVSIV